MTQTDIENGSWKVGEVRPGMTIGEAYLQLVVSTCRYMKSGS